MSESAFPRQSPPKAWADAHEELIDAVIVALQPFDTETLLAVADDARWDTEGWLPKMIREYVSVWR